MLEIKEKSVSTVKILNLKGKITIGSGDTTLRKRIEKLIEEGQRQIVLNMARVSYLDSSGTGELVSCLIKAHRENGQLKLLNISQKIQDILQIAQLFSIFEVFTDESEAVASFLSADK
ncbi:MAG: anti-sigma factor antagonist [Acidobacteria bacterium CG_4_9_14_3_um_filter_49_7]|nr:MAG: anti-sigma factor antagonist [Acidobacteria bacterium CG_4_9_14_3_um_filter_49_7]